MAQIYQQTPFASLLKGAEEGYNDALAIQNAEVERAVAEIEDVADYGVMSPYSTKYMKMFEGLAEQEQKQLRRSIVENIHQLPAANVLTYFGRSLGEKLLNMSIKDRMDYLRLAMGGSKEPPNFNDLADQKIFQFAEKYPNKKIFQEKNAGQLLLSVSSAEALKSTGSNTSPEMNAIYNLYVADMNPTKKEGYGQYTGFMSMNPANIVSGLDNYAWLQYSQGKMNSEQYHNARLANAMLGKAITTAKTIPDETKRNIWTAFDKSLDKIINSTFAPLDPAVAEQMGTQLRGLLSIPSQIPNTETKSLTQQAQNFGRNTDAALIYEAGGQIPSKDQPFPIASDRIMPPPAAATNAIVPPDMITLPAVSAQQYAPPQQQYTATPATPQAQYTPTPTPAQEQSTPAQKPAPRAPVIRALQKTGSARGQERAASAANKVKKGRDYFNEVLTNYDSIGGQSGLQAYRQLKSSLRV